MPALRRRLSPTDPLGSFFPIEAWSFTRSPNLDFFHKALASANFSFNSAARVRALCASLGTDLSLKGSRATERRVILGLLDRRTLLFLYFFSFTWTFRAFAFEARVLSAALFASASLAVYVNTTLRPDADAESWAPDSAASRSSVEARRLACPRSWRRWVAFSERALVLLLWPLFGLRLRAWFSFSPALLLTCRGSDRPWGAVQPASPVHLRCYPLSAALAGLARRVLCLRG